MRIGEIARRGGISVDRIRFYVREGLLIPEAHGKQQHFGAGAWEDLKLLLHLKELGFSLREVHRVLSLRRVAGTLDEEDREDLRALYARKRCELESRRDELERAMAVLDRELEEMTAPLEVRPVRTGLPLRALDLLRCPRCAGTPSLAEATLDSRGVHEGTLTCPCGYEARIREGILRTGNVNPSAYDRPDLTRELYKDLSSPLITLFAKAHEWMFLRMDRLSSARVVLETHPNAYFFLHMAASRAPRGPLYVVVDKFPETLEMYKRKLDRSAPDLEILYLADASLDLPLRGGCVEGFVDFFGSNEHGFYHHQDLICGLERFFSPQALVLGTYFHYPPGGASVRQLCREYPEAAMHDFDVRRYRQILEDRGFRVEEEEPVGAVTDPGKNLAFSFHRSEEELGLWSFLARRDEGRLS